MKIRVGSIVLGLFAVAGLCGLSGCGTGGAVGSRAAGSAAAGSGYSGAASQVGGQAGDAVEKAVTDE